MEFRAYAAESNEIDSEERTIVSTISTDSVDRYKTILQPDGVMLDNYRKNPVVLCNHGLGDSEGISHVSGMPIGKNLWVKVSKRKLIAKTKFLPRGEDEQADKVFRLFELGYLNAWSVRMNPIEFGLPTSAEIRARPELAECRQIFRKWDLIEYSAVTLPANPDAVQQARSLGLELPGWPEAQEQPEQPEDEMPPEQEPAILPPLVGRRFASVERAVLDEITRQLSNREQVARDLMDLARGQV